MKIKMPRQPIKPNLKMLDVSKQWQENRKSVLRKAITPAVEIIALNGRVDELLVIVNDLLKKDKDATYEIIISSYDEYDSEVQFSIYYVDKDDEKKQESRIDAALKKELNVRIKHNNNLENKIKKYKLEVEKYKLEVEKHTQKILEHLNKI